MNRLGGASKRRRGPLTFAAAAVEESRVSFKRLARLVAGPCAALMLLLAAPSAHAAQYFGFNDPWMPDNAATTIGFTRQLGANSERVQIYWGSVEPRPGVYRWTGLDTAYQLMLSNGVRPLLDVVSAPGWAAAPGCDDIFRCQQVPRHDGAFAAFIRFLVARYPQAVGIEIGNEPNMRDWSMHPDPARYAQMLKVGYAAVKEANPNMPVITGGTCCTNAHTGGSIPATEFLNQLYANGIRGHYDYLGFHLYPGGPVSRVAPDLKLEMNRMRGVRDAHGDRSPFWITETGFPSRGVSAYGGGVFDEQNQAQREAIDYRVVQSIPDVVALYFYRLTDSDGSVGANMGFYHADLTPKPAVQALLDAERQPPWPTYTLAARGPVRVRAGHFFQVSVAGPNLPAGAQFDWVIWRAPYWSHFPGGTPQRTTRLRIWHPGTYLLAAQMTTSVDSYLSAPVRVQVVLKLTGSAAAHGQGGRTSHHRHAKRHRKRHRRRGPKRRH
jgi:polysaccharide biosynthesis protein PslG